MNKTDTTNENKQAIIRLNCPDAVGLLARITGFIAESGGNLLDVSQYTDTLNKWFFVSFLNEFAARNPH